MAFIRKDGGPLDWVSVAHRKNREPTDDSQKELSYKGLLWELNLVDDNYNPGHNNGGSNNYYKGQYTSVTDDDNPANNGPWYITYSALDENRGTGKYKFEGHIDDQTTALKSYYADRIVLRQELDYALDKNYVNKYQLGTYYTGVGLWWDSWEKSRKYIEANKEVPDGTYFTSTTYSEIFNDYAYNRATGNYAHAEGYHTYIVSSNYAHTEGNTTLISNSENAHAEGLSTIIDGANGAHAEGNSTKVFRGAHSSHAEGMGSYTKGVGAHAENSAYANGKNSHAGGEAIASGESSFAHGKKGTVASGAYSVAFNYGFAYGDYSFSEGSMNLVNGSYSHAEGEKNTVNSAYSHSEGKSNYVNSEISHAEGCYNYVGGMHSHVEGHHNASYADDTHIEGRENKIESSGFYSHIEGSYNTIKLRNSHAEGTYNIVNGAASHAEGFTNNVNSDYAHAEGANNITNGVASHTEGLHNYTYNANEHAEGKWNQAYTTNTHSGTLHTIGDGADATHRHNVVTVFNDGEIDIDSKKNVYMNVASDISTYSNTLHLTTTNDYTLTSRSTYVISSHLVIGAKEQNSTGKNSVVIGNNNTSSNQASVAIGESNVVNGHASVLLGLGLKSTEKAKVSVGKYNKSYTEGIFEVGIGKDDNNRQNAFTAYASGVTYFHYQPYTYDSYINSVTYGSGQYSSAIYPDQSPVVSLSYYNLSYKGLYDTTTYAIKKINSVDAVQTLDSISRSYTTNTLNYTSGHYDKDKEQNVTTKHTIVQNSATKELAGLMSGVDKVRSDDIEDRLNATVKSANLPTFSLNSITWKVYNNNKSKVLATYTTDVNSTTKYTSITAEYGTYVTADNYTIKMNLASNYDAAFLASVTTTGDFTMPPLSEFSPIAGGSAVMSKTLSLASTYISPYSGGVTSKSVASADQKVSAIRQFGLQYLTTRTLANGHTQVYRINDPDTYNYNQNAFNVKVTGAFGIIRWYGTTDTNPGTFPTSMTQAALEAYMTGQKNSDKTNSKSLVYAGKTDASHRYFFYVYRKALTAVKSVQSVGANATGWFNTSNQITLTITRTTTGMKEDYYLIYSMNENGLSKGDTLTFA